MDHKMREVVDRPVLERDNILKLIEDYEMKISQHKEDVNSENSGLRDHKNVTVNSIALVKLVHNNP